MSRVQLPPAQNASGRYVQGIRVLGVTNEDTGLAVTLYTTAEGATTVTYPVTSDIEGAFAAYADDIGDHLVQFHADDDVLHNPARWEALSAGLLAAATAQTFYVEGHYRESDLEAEADLLPMIRAIELAVAGAADDDGEPPGSAPTPGYGFGTVVLRQSKGYVIPCGSDDPVVWADPFTPARLIVDVARMSLRGGRGTRIRTEDTEGVLMRVTAKSNRVWGTSSFAGMGAVIEDIALQGPTLNDYTDAGTAIGVLMEVEDLLADVAHTILRGIMISGFHIGWKTGDNVHQNEWENCLTTFNRVGWFFPYDTLNDGEKFRITGGTTSNGPVGLINETATSLVIDGHSFDYCQGSLDAGDRTDLGLDTWADDVIFAHVLAHAGATLLDRCHIEDNRVDDYWMRVYGDIRDETTLTLRDCRVIYGATLAPDKEMFYVDESCVQGGLVIDGLHLHPSISGGETKYRKSHLVAGGGSVSARRVIHEDRGVPNSIQSERRLCYPPVSPLLDVTDGSFDDATYALDDWDLTGSTAVGDYPSRAAVARPGAAGTGAIHFQVATNGNIAKAGLNLQADPGDRILSSWWLKTLNLPVDGLKSLNLTAFFVDANDVNVAAAQSLAYFQLGVTPIAGLDSDGWSLHHGCPIVVPKCDAVRLFIHTAGSWTTDIEAWIDDLSINIV